MTDEILGANHWPDNGHMIADAARLGYLPDPVLDCTYGEGTFWSVYRPVNLVFHDIALKSGNNPDGVDFRHLPYDDGTFASITYDPPYRLNGGQSTGGEMDRRYGTTERLNRDGKLQLIRDGFVECHRVLRRGGFLLAKVQDQVEGGHVRWQGDMLSAIAPRLGMSKVDQFIYLGGRAQPRERKHKDGNMYPVNQGHARHNWSSLLVFENAVKPKR